MALAAFGAGLFLYFHLYRLDLVNAYNKMVPNSLVISGTLLGFLITILTLLSTIQTRRMQWVRGAGAYPRLQGFLTITIVWHLVNIFLILLLPIIEELIKYKSLIWSNVLMTIVVFTILYTLTLSVRFIRYFIMLLKESD